MTDKEAPGRPTLTVTDRTEWRKGTDGDGVPVHTRRDGRWWLCAYRVAPGRWAVRITLYVVTGTGRRRKWHVAGEPRELPGVYEGGKAAMAAADEWLACKT